MYEVLIYSLITAVCTGLWAIPFFFSKKISQRTLANMNAIAAALMIAASFWLIYQWLDSRHLMESRNMRDVPESVFWVPFVLLWVSLWVIVWLVFIIRCERRLQKYDNLTIDLLKWANAKKALLIVGVMTLHSFTEGVAIWVSFWPWEAFWIYIALALALHNIPEWLAISAVMVPRWVSPWHAALWSIFSSLPQPLMAIPAFLFVDWFSPFLPIGLGFAAWAMLRMSFAELLPEAYHENEKDTVATLITLWILGMIIFQYLLWW